MLQSTSTKTTGSCAAPAATASSSIPLLGNNSLSSSYDAGARATPFTSDHGPAEISMESSRDPMHAPRSLTVRLRTWSERGNVHLKSMKDAFNEDGLTFSLCSLTVMFGPLIPPELSPSAAVAIAAIRLVLSSVFLALAQYGRWALELPLIVAAEIFGGITRPGAELMRLVRGPRSEG